MWRWLESTYDLQAHTYNYRIGDFADQTLQDRVSQELADYLDKMQTAAVQELAELREEFSWKPWATDPPFANRRRLIDESVDVLHFMGNILVALGVSDEEFWSAYKSKQDINRRRAASGTYSAKKGGLAEGSDVDS